MLVEGVAPWRPGAGGGVSVEKGRPGNTGVRAASRSPVVVSYPSPFTLCRLSLHLRTVSWRVQQDKKKTTGKMFKNVNTEENIIESKVSTCFSDTCK